MIVVRKTNSFSKIRQEWQELYENNTELSYYQSVQIMDVLWHNLLPYRLALRISPRFYVFTENEKIVMILPLFKKWFSNKYTGYGFKAGLGYIDAAYHSDISLDTISECFIKLGKKENVHLNIEHVQSKTPLGKWLRQNGGVYAEEGYTVIDLPADYETYYGTLSKHMKQNLRTAYNRLKTDDREYIFECVPYKRMHGLEKELQNLYINRQITKYKKSRLYSLFVKYIDLGTKFQKAKDIDMRAFVLRINGTLAAYYDGILSDRGIIVPRLAIADGFDRYSPGVMLLNESVRYLIKEEQKMIDLTHGTEPYKTSMGGKVHQCVECEKETNEMGLISDTELLNAPVGGAQEENISLDGNLNMKRVKDIKVIEQEWRILNKENKDGTIYESFEYAHMIWENLLPYIFIFRITPVFYIFYKGDKPIMILPLFKKWLSNSHYLYGYKAGCAYLNAIHGNSLNEYELEDIMALFKKTGIRLIVYRVQAETLLGQFILKHGGKTEEEPCVYIPVWENYAEYLASLSKNSRHNVRRAYNRAERDGKNIEFVQCEYNEILQKDVNKIYCDRQIEKYYGLRKVLFRFFANHIDVGSKTGKYLKEYEHLFMVKIDNEVVSYVDTAIYNGQITFLRLAIDDNYGFYNPGKVLLNELMRYASETQKYKILDTTHGNDRYKLEMGGVEKYCVQGIV